jgi:hypothetical protein
VTPASQRWANVLCLVFGLGLGAVGLGALGGFAAVVNVKEAGELEDVMYKHKVAAKEIEPNEHKRKQKPAAAKQQAAAPSPSPQP